MSRKILEEFIDLYKSLPCLWKVKSKEYYDRQLREAAYDVLLQKLKESEPRADKDAVLKKITNLRCSVRKEKKKYESSLNSGASADDIYQPRLWYYHLMSFLSDQDTHLESTSHYDIQEESMHEIDVDDYQENENNVEGIDSENDIQNSTVVRSDVFNPPSAEKTKKNDTKLHNEVLLSVRDHLKRPKMAKDRFRIIAKSFAIKLKELKKRQRIIAEKLIYEVLSEAEMDNLTSRHKLTTAAEIPSSFYPQNHSTNSNFNTNSNYSGNGIYSSTFQENDIFADITTTQQTQPDTENATHDINTFINSHAN